MLAIIVSLLQVALFLFYVLVIYTFVHFCANIFLEKARKRKWKEKKLMNEYTKVHQNDTEVAESLPADVEPAVLSLCQAFSFFKIWIVNCSRFW